MEDSAAPSNDGLVEVRATGIRRYSTSETPFLVLQETGGDRTLLIGIGEAEAAAIAFALQQVEVKRPMTHDALKQMVDALGARLQRIVIGFQPEAHTFTADVVLAMGDGREQHLDWRPSDSVVLAVRCVPPPPIFVPEPLLAEPPPWLPAVGVRCSCGEWMRVAEDVITEVAEDLITEAAQAGAPHVEIDIDCPSCGQRSHVRLDHHSLPGGSIGPRSDPPGSGTSLGR